MNRIEGESNANVCGRFGVADKRGGMSCGGGEAQHIKMNLDTWKECVRGN